MNYLLAEHGRILQKFFVFLRSPVCIAEYVFSQSCRIVLDTNRPKWCARDWVTK